MDLARLQELKHALLHDESLSQVWRFFMDHFADHPEIAEFGEPARHPFVETVLAQVGQQLFGGDGSVSQLLLRWDQEHQFLHGGFHMGHRPGGVIFFGDIQTGMLAVPEGLLSDEMKFARFSGTPMPKHRMGKPSAN
jgi:hypothetical protein